MTATIEIPMDDSQIAQALEAVDQHLDAFVRAMGEVQACSAAPTARLSADTAREDLGRLEFPPSSDQENAPRIDPHTKAVTVEPMVETQTTTHPALESSSAIPDKKAHTSKASHNKEEPRKKPSRTAASQRTEKHPSSEEEESLLASLDEKTAAAIRVMRRVSMGTKTVRELLEEYEATRHETPRFSDKASRRSWFWKRGQDDE